MVFASLLEMWMRKVRDNEKISFHVEDGWMNGGVDSHANKCSDALNSNDEMNVPIGASPLSCIISTRQKNNRPLCSYGGHFDFYCFK